MHLLPRGMVTWCCLCATVGALDARAAGEEPPLLGARRVIDAVLTSAQTSAPPNGTPAQAQRAAYGADLARFTSNSAALPPEAAAQQWLALYDRFWRLPAGTEDNRMNRYGWERASNDDAGVDVQTLLAAVPGPAAWDALLKLAETRTATPEHPERDLLLRLYVLYLNGRFDRCLEEVKRTTDSLAKKNPTAVDQMRYAVRSLRRSLRDLADDHLPGGMATAFERQIDEAIETRDQNVEITMPDLLALTDTNRATQLIEKVVRVPRAVLTVKGGEATKALVRSVVLRHLSELQTPPWELVGGSDTIAFYEALTKAFPPKPAAADLAADDEDPHGLVRRNDVQDDWRIKRGRDEAAAVYLWALVTCGRLDDAVKLALDPAANPLRELDWETRHDRLGAYDVAPQASYDFFAKVLERRPDLPVWTAFANAALSLGRTNDVLAQLRACQQKGGKPQARNWSDLANAYLTLDAADDAAMILRQAVRLDLTGISAETASRQTAEAQAIATRLVDLGRVLERPALINESIALMRCIGTQEVARRDRQEASDSLSRLLIENGRDTDAEQVLLARLVLQKPQPKTTQDAFDSDRDMQAGMPATLAELVHLYADAKRPADIVALLRDAPWWGAADLQEVAGGGYSCQPDELLPRTAAALLATGDTNAARTVAEEAVRRNPGFDPGYQVLLQTGDDGLLAWLDQRYARDRFEERPLIWKASLLLKQGRLDEAEQTVRQALKVDPTDGETRAGDRVRGYAVLADVLEARGKQDDAAFFRRVVASVRMAENGDRFKEAGLVQRSLPFYEQASGLFAEAYCVQWRLAERLWALGQREEAQKHYAIAFERMPEQFGQLAHLCFGCEGVFDKPESRSVAERVLANLVENGPARPQVHFLLGQLREKQGRIFEAYQEFRQAVEIDPGYMDGWMRLGEIASETAVPQAERDRIALAMLKLDPLGRHTCIDPAKLADLRSFWMVQEQNQALLDAPPASILPLPASARELAAAAQTAGASARNLRRYQNWSDRSRERANGRPGAMLAAGQVVQSMLEFRQALEQLASATNAGLPVDE